MLGNKTNNSTYSGFLSFSAQQVALALLIAVPALFSILWISTPSLRWSFIAEGYFLDSLTAFTFACGALAAVLIIWVYRQKPMKMLMFLLMPLLSGIFFFEEVHYFGAPIRPAFGAAEWEGLHHLIVQMPLQGWQLKILGDPRMAFYMTGLLFYGSLIALFVAFVLLVLRGDYVYRRMFVHLLPVMLMLLVATVIDSPVVNRTFTLEFIEELLELEASLALVSAILFATITAPPE